MAKKEVLVITESNIILGEIDQEGLNCLKLVKEGRSHKSEITISINQDPPKEKVKDILGENHEINLDSLFFDEKGPIKDASIGGHRAKLANFSKN